MTDWRDIASVPHDGRWVLLRHEGVRGLRKARWCTVARDGVPADGLYGWKEGERGAQVWTALPNGTHWTDHPDPWGRGART